MLGYAHLASLMAQQDEFAIFRAYRALGMQNLLYLQAQIAHIQEELQALVNRDHTHPDRAYHSRDWWSLSQGETEEDVEQWEKVIELRGLLDKYYDTLLRQRAITSMKQPREYDLVFLREWLERPSMGAMPLLGLDRTSWDPVHQKDLVSLNPRIPSDIFSAWFSEQLLPKLHRYFGRRIKSPVDEAIGQGIYNYEEHLLTRTLDVIATVAASLLPMLSIVLLFLIESEVTRLGIVILFSGLFAFALCLMTSARRVEVFAATAAFAAVNVVFLTNDYSPTT